MADGSESWSESEFEESTSQSPDAKHGPSGKSDFKNQPYDEALDVSQSVDDPSPVKDTRRFSNQKYDEAFDLSGSLDKVQVPSRGPVAGTTGKPSAGPIVNKPFDEAFEVSDQESESSSVDTRSIGKNSPAPRAAPQQAYPKADPRPSASNYSAAPSGYSPAPTYSPVPNRAGDAKAHGDMNVAEESSDESEDDESASAIRMEGAYDPNDYAQLPVSSEIRELFNYIQRYKPHDVELDSTLKCFVPDYLPAVGEMDAFIKVPPPDGTRDELGLKVLDEPASQQSDATVLELQLRAISKKQHGEVAVRSIENAAKNPQAIDRWIKSIQDLHTQKHSVEVQYKRNMPDIESLMAEWPPEFEEMLQQLQLPGPEMELSVNEYAKVICALMDIPVYENIVESLHVLFSLYMAFKENPHFANRSKEAASDEQLGDNGNMEAQVFTLDG